MPKASRQFATGHIDTATAATEAAAVFGERDQKHPASHGRSSHHHRQFQFDIQC